MPAIALVGLQFGDEGKGKITDMLSRSADAVVRFQGGANAGHRVIWGEQTFSFRLVPSGVLYPDKLNLGRDMESEAPLVPIDGQTPAAEG